MAQNLHKLLQKPIPRVQREKQCHVFLQELNISVQYREYELPCQYGIGVLLPDALALMLLYAWHSTPLEEILHQSQEMVLYLAYK